jgi:hypothetical protein
MTESFSLLSSGFAIISSIDKRFLASSCGIVRERTLVLIITFKDKVVYKLLKKKDLWAYISNISDCILGGLWFIISALNILTLVEEGYVRFKERVGAQS